MTQNTDKSHQENEKKEDVKNYRTICTLSALYKLFSTILRNRLYSRLDQIQSEDQGGNRRSYIAMDHLATVRILNDNDRSGESKYGRRQLTLWRRSTPLSTALYVMSWNFQYRSRIHQSLQESIQRPTSNSSDWQREWHVRDQKWVRVGRPAIELTLQHFFCRWDWKTIFHTGKRKKEWKFTQIMMITTVSRIRALLMMYSCLLQWRSSFKKYYATSKMIFKKKLKIYSGKTNLSS